MKEPQPAAANVELRIERLVLHDMPAQERHRIKAGVERELARLLVEYGLPVAAGEIRMHEHQVDVPAGVNPDKLAQQVARSLFEAFLRGELS